MAINEWAVLVRHATESGKQRTLLAVDVAQVEATAGLNLHTTPWKVLRGVQVEDLGGRRRRSAVGCNASHDHPWVCSRSGP